MNRDFLEEFVEQIEELSKTCDKNDYVKDSCGSYLKHFYLDNLITETRKFMKYGEYKIALEMLLDNLAEVSIVLDEKVINLARQEFGEAITVDIEELLNNLTKKV
jgi:hypothetical protein